MIGICTDTAFFIHGDSIDNMEKALFLLRAGKLDYEKEIVSPIKDSPWKLRKLHGVILSNMKKEVIDGKTVAYSWATKKEYENQGLNVSEIRMAIGCMQDIRDLDLIFVITEMGDTIKGSFRSKEFDTTIYSRELDGGGHKGASGFMLEKGDIHQAAKKVLSVIREKGFVKADE